MTLAGRTHKMLGDMAHRVMPWWLGYLLLSPVRRIWQGPVAILRPFVREGMTVLEPGPGMGYFTLELARLVGPTGKVVAVDVQPRMLSALRRRAVRAQLDGRIETRQGKGADLGVGDLMGKVDFVPAFALVHEVPDVPAFFGQIAGTLVSGGWVLVAEPRGHVSEADFRDTLTIAKAKGLEPVATPVIHWSRAAVLAR